MYKLRQSIKALLFWIVFGAMGYLAVNYPVSVGLALVALVILGSIITPWIPDPEPKREPMRGIDRFAGRDGF